MAKLRSSTRRRMKSSSFALPKKRKYPIHDKSHARNALSRVAQHGSASEKKQVRAAVRRKYPSIGKRKSTARRSTSRRRTSSTRRRKR